MRITRGAVHPQAAKLATAVRAADGRSRLRYRRNRDEQVHLPFLRPYVAILGRDRAWRFSVAGWFARLVRSTAGIGTILLIAAHGQSYAVGGAASGAVVIGSALAGPFWSRASDRLGQTRVLPVALVSAAISAALLLLSIELDLAPWTWIVAAFLVGASAIDAGALVRARWVHLLRGDDPTGAAERHTALAFEAVLDEFTFVIGPPLVTIIAAAANPVAGFLVGVGASLLGGAALLVQRRTAPVPDRIPAPDAATGFRAWLPAGVVGPPARLRGCRAHLRIRRPHLGRHRARCRHHRGRRHPARDLRSGQRDLGIPVRLAGGILVTAASPGRLGRTVRGRDALVRGRRLTRRLRDRQPVRRARHHADPDRVELADRDAGGSREHHGRDVMAQRGPLGRRDDRSRP